MASVHCGQAIAKVKQIKKENPSFCHFQVPFLDQEKKQLRKQHRERPHPKPRKSNHATLKSYNACSTLLSFVPFSPK